MRYSLRNRSSISRKSTSRPAWLLPVAAVAAGSIAAVAMLGMSLSAGRPAASTRTVSQEKAGLFAVKPLPCGAGVPGAVGAVVRTTGASARSSLAAQGIGFPAVALAHAGGTTLYVGRLGAALSPSHPSSAHIGVVTVPSVHPAYRSCNYKLRGNKRDRSFKAAAEQAFVAAHLATDAQLRGQGVIWMVADDPTSTSDELVAVDIETPMTSSSPGTVRTLVADVIPSSARILGVAATDW